MRSNRSVRAFLATSFLLVLVPLHAGPGIEPDVDLGLAEEFEAILSREAEGLAANQRLETSMKYRPTENGGYTVYGVIDTAGPEVLETARYRISLAREGKKWQVADKTAEASEKRLVREGVEASAFHRFESFEIDREGLKIAGASGTAATYQREGAPSRVLLSAEGLAYEYAPPRDLGEQYLLHGAIKRTWKDDLVFAPEVVDIACDPRSCEEILASFSGLEEIDAGALSGALASHYTERTDELRRTREKEPFADFRLPLPDGAREYSIRMKKPGKDHWVGLEYGSESDHEVRFHVDGLGTIYGYAAEATRSAEDPSTIERRDDDEGMLYEVTGLEGLVEIGLVEPELLEADIRCTLRAKRDLDAIPFSIDAVLVGRSAEAKGTFHVNELTDGEGRPLSWVRRGDTRGIILLPEPVRAGSDVVVQMEFQTKGNVVKVNSSYAYVARSGWLPFVRFGDKIDTFDLTVKVPGRYKVLGVGSNVSTEKQGRVNVSRWVAKSPVQFPTIIYGDYEEDTPKTKAEKADGSTFPVTVHVDKNSMVEWGIRAGQLRAPGEIAINALNIYRELFAEDYPYGKLDLVNDPLEALGAQAPASIVYLGSAIFRSQATLSFAVARDTTTLVEERIAHEVAHQWWGALVSCANRRNYWFIESLAEYSSALFMEVVASDGFRVPEKGRKAYLTMVKRWRDETLQSGLLGSVQDSSTLWSNGGYVAAVYSRGPYAFHMLRQTFGDQKFFAFLKTLARELGGKEIVTRDIQRIAEQAFGGVGQDGQPYTVDLEWFFDQWIRGVGVPEYVFDYEVQQVEGGGYTIQGKIRQRVLAGKHDVELDDVYYRGIVPVTVLGKDKQEYSAKLVVEGPETPFAFKVPTKPLEVTLNKYGEILARNVRPAR